MTGELYKYDVIFRVKLPGRDKEADYIIRVAANDPIDAQTKGIEEWKHVTAPRDVRVKEVAKVMTAS